MSLVLKYRPEIDGLRAVAVLAVIIFHLDSSLMPGGYTGVDVFFVISGFLITTIILRELNENIFSFKSFYSRRVKRILPPLFIVSTATAVFGLLLLTSTDLAHLAESIKNLTMFYSNFYFGQGGDYFGPSMSEIPLLHTWSLAVEEQFYFIWPLLMLLILRLSVRIKSVIIGMLVFASFAYAEYLLNNKIDRQLAYFSFFSRYGEMLIGASFAILISYKRTLPLLQRRLSIELLSISGIVLLGISFFFLDKKSPFPGIYSLIPVAGATIILLSVSTATTYLQKILSIKPLNHIGRISYPLYLWHWPILAYMRYVYGSGRLPTSWLMFAVIMTYVLSVLTYLLVEQKIRASVLKPSRVFLLFFILPSLLMLSLAFFIDHQILTKKENAQLSTYGGIEVCHFKTGVDCIRGDLTKRPKILVFGDSHAAHLHYFIDRLGKLNGWSAMLVSASSCGPAFSLEFNNLPVASRSDCRNLLEYVESNLEQYDTVIIAARWDFQFGVEASEFNDPDFRIKFQRSLDKIQNLGKRVVLMAQVPSLNSNPFRVERALKLHLPVQLRKTSYYVEANKILLEIAKEKKMEVLELASLFSLLEEEFLYQGIPVYMDNNHLNQLGARVLADLYFRNMQSIRF